MSSHEERLAKLAPADHRLVRELAVVLAAIPDVAFAYLFGSRARGKARPDSDVDLALMLAEPAAGFDHAERILYLAPLLLPWTGNRLDLVFLDMAGNLLGHRVLRDGILIHEKDLKARVRHYVRAVSAYLDTAPLREAQLAATIRRGRRRRVGRPRDPRQTFACLGRLRE